MTAAHTPPDRQLAAVIESEERFENLLIDGRLVCPKSLVSEHLADADYMSGKAGRAKRMGGDERRLTLASLSGQRLRARITQFA